MFGDEFLLFFVVLPQSENLAQVCSKVLQFFPGLADGFGVFIFFFLLIAGLKFDRT